MTHASFEARIRRIEAQHRDPDFVPGQVIPGVDEGGMQKLKKGRAHLRHLRSVRRGAWAALWSGLTVLLALKMDWIDAVLPGLPGLKQWRDQVIAGLASGLVLSGAALAVMVLRSLLARGDTREDMDRAMGILAGVLVALALPVLLSKSGVRFEFDPGQVANQAARLADWDALGNALGNGALGSLWDGLLAQPDAAPP